jgi:hypothetical protein
MPLYVLLNNTNLIINRQEKDKYCHRISHISRMMSKMRYTGTLLPPLQIGFRRDRNVLRLHVARSGNLFILFAGLNRSRRRQLERCWCCVSQSCKPHVYIVNVSPIDWKTMDPEIKPIRLLKATGYEPGMALT